MNFKAPRDPNTKVPDWKIRDVLPSEGIHCQVGSGECLELAVESQDDGSGHEFFVCSQHAKEMIALEKLIAEMTPNQIKAFDGVIRNAESQL